MHCDCSADLDPRLRGDDVRKVRAWLQATDTYTASDSDVKLKSRIFIDGISIE
jgi:hypothetical protein